jgi:internalin A
LKVLGERTKPADPEKILEYYFRTREGKRPLNEAKLIFVGRGEVGKTSLVNRLVYNKFNIKERKTDGIQISEWEIDLKKNDKVRLNIWDFGGQEIMHATHQFFLTARSLYILVLDGRGRLEDNDAEYWLKIISSFGAASPVIIVLNKIKAHPFDLNRKALQEKYPFIKEFVKTDCKNGSGIDQLLKVIKKQTNALKNLRDPFPAVWFKIKEKIAFIDKNFLSFDEFKKFCKANGESEDTAQGLLAGYLHDLGIALNYSDDPRLKDTHILNPHWVTNGIYKILNSDLLEKNKGEISLKDLSKILNKKIYPAKMHQFLMDLMKKFELCFNFPDDDCHYLIPELLDKQEPDVTKQFKPEECLNFQYDYAVLPVGLLPRFIVRTYTLSHGLSQWRSGAILQLEGCKAFVKADIADKRVYIRINGPIEKRRKLLAVIRSDFERIHYDIKNLLPDEMVPVPESPKTVVLYKKLLELEKNNIATFQEYVDNKIVILNVKDLLNGIDLKKEKRGIIRVFISYSHKDEFYKNQLETHLKILQRQNLISVWTDRRIIAGEDWGKEIDLNLESAHIILLLISADFITSDYCYDIEMTRAVERHNAKEADVIPIPIRKCNWGKAPFRAIQAATKNGKPIKSCKDKDEAWTYVSKEIEKACEKFAGDRGMQIS